MRVSRWIDELSPPDGSDPIRAGGTKVEVILTPWSFWSVFLFRGMLQWEVWVGANLGQSRSRWRPERAATACEPFFNLLRSLSFLHRGGLDFSHIPAYFSSYSGFASKCSLEKSLLNAGQGLFNQILL